ncbi:MAG TPA: hypothetical protein VFV34_01120, partial [Blastocatellia bacterium]|nr:hypothetical protein [Blastocatellia bacterium]
ALIAVLMTLIAAGSGVTGAGQRSSLSKGEPESREGSIAQLHKLPGQVISEGKNDLPVGMLNLKRYRLEELDVPPSLDVRVAGRDKIITQAWRLTIVGGPFPVRDMPAIIWLDGNKLGVGVESPDLTQISVIVTDRALLQDRGKITVSYSEDRSDEIELPERLALPRR